MGLEVKQTLPPLPPLEPPQDTPLSSFHLVSPSVNMRLSKQHGPSFNGLFVGGLAASLFGVASAGYQSAVPSSPGGSGGSGSSGSCTFSISSTGGIACPAGQLADGQIRLNGSEPTAYFTISNGQITDSSGRGCIVTGEPP